MTDEEKFAELLEPYRNELRRGVIILAVLSQLNEAQYGYSLIKQLDDQGFEVDQGTLYPLLRRLEDRGLLESDWIVDDSRPRKYYRINQTGKAILAELKSEWEAMVKVLEGVIS